MSKKITYYSILVVLIIGLFGAGILVIEEFKTGEGCPKIMHIPMCLVVLICFIIPLIAHLLKKYNSIYFLFTGLAFLIAIIASVMQFKGLGECPKLDNGIPMCYLSFVLFSILITLKIILINISKIIKK
tara:strand:- start:225 stop:611 length:387 start_codon:yes stop_codon:yes gene_type:complete